MSCPELCVNYCVTSRFINRRAGCFGVVPVDPLSCYAISVFTTAFFFIKIPDRTRRGNEIEESRHTLLLKSRAERFLFVEHFEPVA